MLNMLSQTRGELNGNPPRTCIVLIARSVAMRESFPFTPRKKREWPCLSVRRLPLDRNRANGAGEIGLHKESDSN
jgi:hypothetical protein